MLYTIWCHLYNLENMKNNHGGVLLVVKLLASAITNCTNGTKPRNASHMTAYNHRWGSSWLPSLLRVKQSWVARPGFATLRQIPEIRAIQEYLQYIEDWISEYKRAFQTLQNVYDGAFLRKYSATFCFFNW